MTHQIVAAVVELGDRGFIDLIAARGRLDDLANPVHQIGHGREPPGLAGLKRAHQLQGRFLAVADHDRIDEGITLDNLLREGRRRQAADEDVHMGQPLLDGARLLQGRRGLMGPMER